MAQRTIPCQRRDVHGPLSPLLPPFPRPLFTQAAASPVVADSAAQRLADKAAKKKAADEEAAKASTPTPAPAAAAAAPKSAAKATPAAAAAVTPVLKKTAAVATPVASPAPGVRVLTLCHSVQALSMAKSQCRHFGCAAAPPSLSLADVPPHGQVQDRRHTGMLRHRNQCNRPPFAAVMVVCVFRSRLPFWLCVCAEPLGTFCRGCESVVVATCCWFPSLT